MSGSGHVWVQPATYGGEVGVDGWASVDRNTWTRGIPSPGAPGIAPITGLADCRNVFADSPPTLLELYDIVTFSIASGVLLEANDFTASPIVSIELALLLNDRPVYTQTQSGQTQGFEPGDTNNMLLPTTFSADLINPIRVGARDRLAIRLGFISDQPVDHAAWVYAGAQPTAAPPAPQLSHGVESTISYNVIDMPASRRL